MRQFIFCGADVAFAAGLESRTTSATKYLQHVENGEIYKGSLGAVVHLCPFDDYWKPSGQ